MQSPNDGASVRVLISCIMSLMSNNNNKIKTLKKDTFNLPGLI
jgi:hypothetical protein